MILHTRTNNNLTTLFHIAPVWLCLLDVSRTWLLVTIVDPKKSQ